MTTNVQLTNLSWLPQRPCMLLRWPGTTILLDCALDVASLSNFMPFFYTMSERIRDLPMYRVTGTSSTGQPLQQLPYLKPVRERVYVEGVPEVHPVPLCSVAMDTVDAIVVSNWQSLVALPFYTEGTGFRGKVFASEPTLQFGRLMVEELQEYFARVVYSHAGDAWKDVAVYQQFANAPSRSPMEWRGFYTAEKMEKAFERVRVVAFNESVNLEVGPITLTAYGSGYCIGSCNWVIKTEYEKIGYLSATASRTTHTRSVDWSGLKEADALLVTSLSPLVDNSPESSATALLKAVLETLKLGGNVILPVHPCGTTYDLIDLLAKHIDTASDVPIYVISPVARKSLAYANVYAEWLSDAHLDRVYIPEEPFRHSKLMENRRVRVFDSLYGDFSRELRTPCVVFTGHPSLRIGDAPHLLEMWGNDARNAIILSDADFPPQEVYGPFEDLPIRALFYPIDCRLDYSQLNPNVLGELAPKVLIVPDAYARPHPGRANSSVEYNPLTSIKYEETVSVPCKSKKRKIRVHPEIAAKLKPRGFPSNPDMGVCSLRGMLSCYNNQLELLPAPPSSIAARPQYTGKLSAEGLLKNLAKAGHKVTVKKEEDGRVIFTVEKLSAVITLSADGLHTNIRASRQHRKSLSDAVTAGLTAI